jgi:DNA-binding response OmpR family regulator
MAATLAGALARHGHDARSATSAASAFAVRRAVGPIDLAVLDMSLRGVGAVELGARLRAIAVRSLLLLVDGRDLDARRLALSGGADDYVVKPLSTSELVARADMLLRSARGRTEIAAGDVRIDIATGAVAVAGEPVAITRKERDLVLALARAGGATVSRQRLLVEVWGTDWHGGAQTITVHVSTLRRKLGRPDVIRTVPGGYRLAPSAEPPVIAPPAR